MANATPDNNEDQKLPFITETFRDYLKENFNLTGEFLTELFCLSGMSEETFTRSERILNDEAPVSLLLDELKKWNKKGTYEVFIRCLRSTGNDDHANVLEGYSELDAAEDRLLVKHIMQPYCVRLINRIQPEDILPMMFCFSQEEAEGIFQVVERFGNTRGAQALLRILFKKGMEGFGQLLDGLRKTNNASLATELSDMINSARKEDGLNNLSSKDFDMDWASSSSSYTGTIMDRPNIFEGDAPMEDNTSGYPASAGSSEMQVSGENIQPLRLHNFQKELVQSALKGLNSVIVAPTGSGKTVMAARVVKAFLNREPGVGPRVGNPSRVLSQGSNKVIFLVNKVPLVEQQCSLFKTYMDETRIIGLTGSGMSSAASLSDLLEMKDVLVMTAQILVNALQNPDQNSDQSIELSKIGLLVLDECHHCKKDDPYNAVMSRYCDLKMSSPEAPRPQILGLTASLGVGKGGGQYAAETHILKICANLDTEDLCIVQSEQNKRELRLKRDKPREEIFSVPHRKDDSFVTEMIDVMAKIEAKILKTPAGNRWMRLLGCPKRGSQEYENWLVQMDKFFVEQADSDQTLLTTCKDHLKVLNDCLYINRDARTQDAMNHYMHYIQELKDATEGLNEIEEELVQMFQDKLGRFEMLATSHEPQHQNPLLERLSEILNGSTMKNPDSRGILFCKTRVTTEALIAWIENTPSLAFLNPGRLIGSGGSGGLTQTKQEDLLKMFKDGRHKIIVATSVAEEGLDIQQCNTVIRYNYISNEIGRVQAQGRSRARDGKFYLIVSEELGLADRETRNRIRETMMYKATEGIKNMGHQDFVTQIANFQKVSRQLRLHKQRVKNMMTQNKQLVSVQLVCRKCKKEVCTLDDIRCIENAHHIVLSTSFPERCRLIDHPKPVKKVDFEKLKKVMCGDAKCPQEWGIQMKYKGCKAFALTPVNFIFRASDGRQRVFSKWREMPYKVTQWTIEMLEELGEMEGQDNLEESSDDEDDDVDQEESNSPSS
ncbi:ATP-dependent RNA helicase DHX58-like isoform X2 [Asterias amurensis]|uniref:ATP-dependent RNA helicase DHX58-like isoform X2 n=1 Tax=Asterias amurensis TaxID=7602 RepID=UPI003AB5118E